MFQEEQVCKEIYRSNTPSSFPQEHYKRAVAIPLLDSLITQLKERFSCENKKLTQTLLSLVPSLLIKLDGDLSADDFRFWNEELYTNSKITCW